VAQGGQEGHDLPAAARHLGLDPLATPRPARSGPMLVLVQVSSRGLIDEQEAGGIDPLAILGPPCPPTGNIGTVLLGGNQRLFL
jgi:hypothetical protein